MTTQESNAGRRRLGTRQDGSHGGGLRALRGLLRGVAGSLIATAIMTLYRFPVFRSLPPTADFWAKYVGGGDPKAYPGTGLVLHFLYGGAAGGLFGAGISLVDFRSTRERDCYTIGRSLAYGLALSIFGTRVIFRHLLEEELDRDETLVFHVGHAIYGLTLGTWMRSRDRSGEVYE